LAEARDAGEDDALVDLLECLVIDAEAVLHVGAIVLHHDVGVRHHVFEGGDALR